MAVIASDEDQCWPETLGFQIRFDALHSLWRLTRLTATTRLLHILDLRNYT